MQEATQSNSEKMRQGGIVFSWDEGKHLKRVPYFIVPDSWAKDAAFVDMVVQGMKLKIPNMVLAHLCIDVQISCVWMRRLLTRTTSGPQLQSDQATDFTLEPGVGLLGAWCQLNL